jgi:hypothetical protein
VIYGRYQVTGAREYRGHQTGVVFEARLDKATAQRAINRGDIVLLEHVEPRVPAGFTFPHGWLST